MKLHSRPRLMGGLAGLAGFAAGALLVGLFAVEHPPTSSAAESLRPAVLPASARVAPPVEAISTQNPDRLTVVGPWPFESAAPAPAAAPGRMRPDRLSAPEGWTY
jgi:hypothetical protein